VSLKGLKDRVVIVTGGAGVWVNAVAPGRVDTPLFDRLDSDEAPFITGAVFPIDGGATA
jgi:hypothetical protein